MSAGGNGRLRYIYISRSLSVYIYTYIYVYVYTYIKVLYLRAAMAGYEVGLTNAAYILIRRLLQSACYNTPRVPAL